MINVSLVKMESISCNINGSKEICLYPPNVQYVTKIADQLWGMCSPYIFTPFHIFVFDLYFRLQDWRCMWCRSCVHSTCRARFVQHCSLGETRPYTIPPTCLIEKGVDRKTWNVVEPLPGSPMIVFVNCKSGGGHGEKFLRRFKQILNPGQVFDIAHEGPTYGY